MTNAVQMTQDFQERIFNKIRDDIGTLMTADDIKKLVEATIERVFFTPVQVTGSSYYNDTKTLPPKIETLIQELIEPSLRKAIDKWLSDHTDEVGKVVEKALAGGLTQAVGQAFNNILSSAMMTLQQNIVQSLQITKTY